MIEYFNVILANRNEDTISEDIDKATKVFENWEKQEKERMHDKFMGSIEIVND